MKKISILGTVGLPACYGGFESLVDNITKNKSEDIQYLIYCSSKSYPSKVKTANDADLVYLPFKANGAQSVIYDISSLLHSLFKKPDVTLILGVSGCIFLPIYRFFSKSHIVTNIDGLEWKRDKWSPRIKKFLKYSEKLAVKYSDIVIADNKAIADYVQAEYSVPAEVIAYGGDHIFPDKEKNTPSAHKGDYYLALCRIEPENNIAMILEAFSKIDKKIKFIGNWNNSEYGQKLKSDYSSYENIELIDPIYNIDVLYVYRSECIGYIHGHSAGGTNPSLVEAMHIGKPILAFDCSFNRYSTNNLGHYFLDANSLANLINNLSNEELENNANSMIKIAQEQYCWDIITQQYENCY